MGRAFFIALLGPSNSIFDTSNVSMSIRRYLPLLRMTLLSDWNGPERAMVFFHKMEALQVFFAFYFSVLPCITIQYLQIDATFIMALVHLLILFALSLVSNCIQSVEKKVNYNASDIDSHNFAVQDALDEHELRARQATPYWYEEIPHQGIAAFGAVGYQVYRNVKDYGAKGTQPFAAP